MRWKDLKVVIMRRVVQRRSILANRTMPGIGTESVNLSMSTEYPGKAAFKVGDENRMGSCSPVLH